MVRRGSKESVESSSSDSSSGDEEAGCEGGEGPEGEVGGEEPRETHAAAEISALVNYVQPVHFSSFESAESEYIYFMTIRQNTCSLQPLLNFLQKILTYY